MSFVISSILSFPNIRWWCRILDAQTVLWDLSENFEKMTYRNRYYLAGANGLIRLSIPILQGREHHAAMKDVGISYDQNWQKQHWRTIISSYNRSPYFEFYAPLLEKIFAKRFESLAEFNLAAIHWLKNQLDISFEEETLFVYQKEYPDALHDLRRIRPGNEEGGDVDFPVYYQVFQERNGFLPNLSILDLLFAEGPLTVRWLQEHKAIIRK